MRASKRMRIIEHENRQFSDAWTDEFLMVPLPSGGMPCLECKNTIKPIKRSNAKSHFDVKNSATYAGMTVEFRKERVEGLKNNRRQQTMMRGPPNKIAYSIFVSVVQ